MARRFSVRTTRTVIRPPPDEIQTPELPRSCSPTCSEAGFVQRATGAKQFTEYHGFVLDSRHRGRGAPGGSVRGALSEQPFMIEIGGSPVRYYVAGPDGGRPIVFLLGKRVPARIAHNLGAQKIAAAGFRVHHVDIPGCGETPATDIDVQDWLGLLPEALGVEKPAIVSVGMTGPYSLPFVTRHPERVAAFAAIAIEGIPAYAESLACITAPVLAMWGEWGFGLAELDVRREHLEMLAREAPNARLVTFPGRSYGMSKKDTDALIERLLQFLQELPSSE